MEDLVSEAGVGIEEAARLLGASVNTVRRRIKQGALRAERVSRPQGYTYRVFLSTGFHPPGDGSFWELVDTLRNQVMEKDRQIAVLLSLLQREQGNGSQPSNNGNSPSGAEGGEP